MVALPQDNPFGTPSSGGGGRVSHEKMEDSPHPFQGHSYGSSSHISHISNVVTSPSLRPGSGSTHGAVEQPPRPHVTPLRHPLVTTTPPPAPPSSRPSTDASSVRKEWQKHGTGLTQQVEEIRRRDESRPGTLTVRLISAETRRDVAGKSYTAYILHVRLPHGSNVGVGGGGGAFLQLEHRYSEFAKLHGQFQAHGCHIDSVAPFPGKDLAGRIGNWTPSLRWAPERHDELVQFRKVQLDVWLTHVCERYNVGDLPHSLARSVYEFLTLSDRPPCELENNATDDDGAGGSSSSSSVRWNNPISFTLGSSIRQACRSVEQMCLPQRRRSRGNGTGPSSSSSASAFHETDQSIPLDLLHCAKGLIFLTVLKAGLVVSGRVGTGLLIARGYDDDGDGDEYVGGTNDPYHHRWSAPVALGTVGMGWGMLAGGDITHYLVVLTTEAAVEALLHGTVQLGTEIGVAAGPVGRSSQVSASASQSEWTLHPAYSYAHSQGLFVGMSLEGSILCARHDVNAKFYGKAGLTPDQVLDLPPPKAAEPLYRILEHALATEIPHDGFRPSQLLFPNKGEKKKRFQDSQFVDPSSSVHAGLPAVDNYGRVTVTSDAHPTSPDLYYRSPR